MPVESETPNTSQPKTTDTGKSSEPEISSSDKMANSKDDEDFVAIDAKDIEMQEADAEKTPGDRLELQRFGNNLEDVEEIEDDSEDDHDHMANHPLLNMLSGRLGQRRRGSTHKWDKLHPVTQVLSLANVDDCVQLEDEAFPENERCSREKFEYRLSRCPELSLGLFSRPTQAEADEMKSPPKSRLIAHIVATRSPAPSVTDASMGLPSDWKTNRSSLPSVGTDEVLGHQEVGGTVCIHSVAVVREHQGMGLGTILLKSYIQRIKDSKCAERLALLSHEPLVNFYSSVGFENMGPSAATFGGGNWVNMVLEFSGEEDD